MSALPKVVITDYIVEPLEFERSVLEGVAEVIALDARSEADLDGRIEDADAIMIYHYLKLDRARIETLEKCRLIVRPGVGYDNIDIAAARERGIPVCNVPDYGTEEVADSALGMTLVLSRGTHFLNSRLRRGLGAWDVTQATPIRRLRGRVFGVVGCGRIGSAAALRAKAFGFDVVFYDPYLPDGVEKALGVRRVDRLDDLLVQSHVVSLHCPLTSETRGLIGGAEIGRMPRVPTSSTPPAGACSTPRRRSGRSRTATSPAPGSMCWRSNRPRRIRPSCAPGAIPITRPTTGCCSIRTRRFSARKAARNSAPRRPAKRGESSPANRCGTW